MNRAQYQLERLTHYLRGHTAAIEFCAMFGSITQVWDDLIDRDKSVEDDDIHGTFEMALIHLPANPFYREHFVALHPLIVAAINAWHDSNELPRAPTRSNLARAYTLRDQIDDVVIASARIVGGHKWMREVSMQIRTEITHDDSFEDYCKEFSHEPG